VYGLADPLRNRLAGLFEGFLVVAVRLVGCCCPDHHLGFLKHYLISQ